MLPQVLDPMAGKAGHQQPRWSGDARCRDDHKDRGDSDPTGELRPTAARVLKALRAGRQRR